MARGSHRRPGGRGAKRRRHSGGKVHTPTSRKTAKMAATAETVPATPRDRETFWKMRVHRAVTAGASTVCRPVDADHPTLDDSRRAHEARGDCARDDDDDEGEKKKDKDDDEADAAFVQIALDVLDDHGVLCPRVVPGAAPATIEINPRTDMDAVWGPIVDRVLTAAMASGPRSSAPPDQLTTAALVKVEAIYAACCKDSPTHGRTFESLGPCGHDALRALITARAASLGLNAVSAGSFVYRLTPKDAADTDTDDPTLNDPIYGGPGIGWALFKAYAIAIAVIIPLAMALLAGGD
ncbi:hypothetical protein psal_cds_681 [Pandoravirus salinus]|uniref:DUF5878 domain-containing protein n=1 Tax=Pandoravirus salinus TaxID=1349410 RepID=S4VYR3_9VIRU|nr:hypothetical protein psal_cds_681 [Pandoravirus salinus]AGO84616.1 hypothetical protein psal_cds_681 [Pandoravirus salinus]